MEKEKIIDEEIVGKYFKQNCGDTLLVLNEGKQEGKYFKFKCQFQDFPNEVFALKCNIKRGQVYNYKIDEIIGKVFPQHCGDILKVLRKINEKTLNYTFLFECEFQKYPYKIKATKGDIKNGTILNPRIEIEEFVNKIWLQNCGDSLRILRKTKEKTASNEYLWEAEFIKYPYKIKNIKSNIIRGQCLNPLIEEKEFIGKIFPQNCGDSVKVLRKTNEIRHGLFLYEVEYQKYPYKELKGKGDILNGTCVNPRIEEEEFKNKIWPQNCGDTLKIIRKTNIKNKKNDEYLWEAEFQKYPYRIKRTKSCIKSGNCINPRIEEEEFIGHIFPQYCGDSCKVLRKTNEIKYGFILYEIEYQKYPYKEKRKKQDILRGSCLNPRIEEKEFINKIWPQKCGDSLRIIKKTDKKGKKSTNFLWEAEFINYPCKILQAKHRIIQGLVKNPKAPNYKENLEENSLREYIKSIYKGEVIIYNDAKYEIDVYLPEIKKGYEYNGSRWHEEGNPNNPYSKPIGYHEKKKKYFKEKGIDIYYIWDKEWYEDYPKKKVISESCKQKIKDIILNN